MNYVHPRYFKLKSEARKLFPDFADIDPTELPTNEALIAQASTCVSGLNTYIEHLGENPRKCPFVAKGRAEYYHSDLKVDSQFQRHFISIIT